MNDRLPEVIVNADLARLADPPRRRCSLLLTLAWLNVCAGASALIFGTGPVAVWLAAGDIGAALRLARIADARRGAA